MAKKAASCKAATIKFKTKRGRVVEFAGRTGAKCGPRKKPSTRHLAPYKQALAAAARSCKRKKLSRGAFLNCVSSAMPK